MIRTLYRNGVVHSASHPFAQALTVEDGVVTWLGDEDTADRMGADETVDLDGALVTPAFVDAYGGHAADADPAAHGVVSVHRVDRDVPEVTEPGDGESDGLVRYGRTARDGRLALEVTAAQSTGALAQALAEATAAQVSALLVASSPEDEARAVAALTAVADQGGVPAVARAGHRIVGLTSLSGAAGAELVRLGVRATFLAPHLPLASAAALGVPTSIGGVTADPWGVILESLSQEPEGERVSARAAFRAATRGGWRAAGRDDVGEVHPGAPAHLAVWRASHLGVQTPRSAWSSDARAGTPLLPFLEAHEPRPTCLRTVRGGVVIYDTLT